MSRIFVPIPSIDKLELYLSQDFDGFFIGIKDYSENYNNLLDLDDLEEYIKLIRDTNKKIFVCFNRLYYNEEIDNVRNMIELISKLDIDGFGFTDIGVLNILNEIQYNGDILWLSNHLGTNSKTINFLEKRNVKYALLSNEITIDEIIEIKKNTKISIGATLYGFLNMATSSRKLISNYFMYNNINKNKDKYYIKDKVKNEKYIIKEGFNTNFFTGKVLNGIKYFPKLIDNNIDYIFLDNYLLDEVKFYNVIEAFSSLRNAQDDTDFINKLYQVVEVNTEYDTFSGFLDKKTVVKVKDYE